MGYSENNDPNYVIPTAIATRDAGNSGGGGSGAATRTFSSAGSSSQGTSNLASKRGIDDLDYFIGDEAMANAKTYGLNFPIRHGQVENWDLMEKFHQACLFQYLRCEPEDHHFLLTEPPLNAPENREYTAEIFFESFGIKGLYIAVQAVLALAATWTKNKTDYSLTGTVIDSGDGVTHVIPVVKPIRFNLDFHSILTVRLLTRLRAMSSDPPSSTFQLPDVTSRISCSSYCENAKTRSRLKTRWRWRSASRRATPTYVLT